MPRTNDHRLTDAPRDVFATPRAGEEIVNVTDGLLPLANAANYRGRELAGVRVNTPPFTEGR
jgi:hypothetical protein